MASVIGQALARQAPRPSQARRRRVAAAEVTLTAFLMFLDLVSILGGVVAGFLYNALLHHAWAFPTHNGQLAALLLVYWFIFVTLGWSSRLYASAPSMLQARLTERILRISCFGLVFTGIEWYVLRGALPGSWFAVTWVASVVLLLVNKHAARGLFRLLAGMQASRKVLIVGTGRDARRIFSYLLHFQQAGVPNIRFVDETGSKDSEQIYSHDYRHRVSAPVHHGPLTEELLRHTEASEVYLADPLLSIHRVQEISELLLLRGTACSVLSTTSMLLPDHHGTPGDFDGVPMIMFPGRTETQPFYELSKRIVDSVTAAGMLLLVAPAFVCVAVAVRCTSRGPVFFRQERVGRNGELFTMFKFRSMYVDAPKYSRSPEDARDPRITLVGRFLRKTSVDELPQLLNVLRGDMSLVGPRPEMPYIVEQYTMLERRRLQVAQGLTGLWQLSADRKYSIHESVEYDLYYVQNRTFFLDIAILLHTLLFAVKGI